MGKDCKKSVCQAIERVLKESGRPVPDPITDNATLQETLKLDSLDLAVVVVALETDLGVDPFRSGAAPVQTVGQLVDIYQKAIDA